MHWDTGLILAMVQIVVMLGLLVMGAGAWKARREDSTKNLGGQLQAVRAALTEVQNLVVGKQSLAACEARFKLISDTVDQMVPREHCETLHRQIGADVERTDKLARDVGQAAQTVVTATAVITQQVKGLTDSMADTTRRLGRIEAALMKVQNGSGATV